MYIMILNALLASSLLFWRPCYSFSPATAIAGSKFTIERGNMASIFNAAYYMTIERMNIPVEQASLSSPVFNMMYLHELNRLKENYTKDPEVHQVIVAKSVDDEIIGYVDIDRRNIFNKRFPTPYISDLVVQQSWRNKGVGRSLLEYCIETVCKSEWLESHVHLLVETHNSKAINLYNKLLFVPVQAETGPIDDASKIKIIAINESALIISETFNYEKVFENESVKSILDSAQSNDDSRAKRDCISLDELLQKNVLSTYDRLLLRKKF